MSRYEHLLKNLELISERYRKSDISKQDLNLQTLSKLFEQQKQIESYEITPFNNQDGIGMIMKGKTNDTDVAIKCLRIQDFELIKHEVYQLIEETVIPQACELIKLNKNAYYFRTFKKYSYDLKCIMNFYFENKIRFTLDQIIQIALQISQAISILRKYIYFRISPSNIFYEELTKTYEISGYCRIQQSNDCKVLSQSNENLYSAPVDFDDDFPIITNKFDVFSLGLIILEMTNGMFINETQANQIRSGNLGQYLSSDQTYAELNQIIQSMLRVSVALRISPKKLVQKLNELKDKLENKFQNYVQNMINDQKVINDIKQSKYYLQEIHFDYEKKIMRLDYLESIVKFKFNQAYFNKNQNLCVLDFSKNQIYRDGSRYIGESSVNFQNMVSLIQNQSLNKIDDVGANNTQESIEQCQIFLRVFSNLIYFTKLLLNDSQTQIGSEAAKMVIMKLEKSQNIKSLALNLDQNEIIGQEQNYTIDNQKPILDQLLEFILMRLQIFSKNEIQFQESYKVIVSCYNYLSDIQKALEFNLKLLELKQRDDNQNQLQIAISLNEVGICHLKLKNNKKSLSYFLESFLILKQIYKMKGHPNITSVLDNIGKSYQSLGNNDNALCFYQKSFEMRKKIFQGSSSQIVYSLKEIGNFYFNIRNYQQSLEYSLQSLQITKQIHLERHQSIVTQLSNVSSCYLYLQDNQKALLYQLELLEMLTKMVKLNSPEIATRFNKIGIIYQNLKQNQKAEQYLLKSLNIRKRIFKGNNSYVADSMMNVAIFYQDNGQYQKALGYFYQALPIMSRIYQKNHKLIVLCSDRISDCKMKLGQYESALQFLQRSLEIKKQIYNQDNELILQGLNNLGYCYLELNQYETAIKYYQDCFKLLKDQKNSNLKTNTILFLNVAYQLIGDKENSQKYFQQDSPQFQEQVELYLLKFQKNSEQKKI